jgi:ribosome-interacting GTPase 1
VTKGATVLDLAAEIHGELADAACRARIWGPSAKFPGQEVGLDHALRPGDTVEVLTR